MAKSTKLGLELTESQLTLFEAWWLQINGNNESGSESNMQLIDMFADEISKTISEYADFASFPSTGVVKRFYIALDTGSCYRWDVDVEDYILLVDYSVAVSESAPTTPVAGDLWWNSATGILKIYYFDGDSYQWVDATPASGDVNVIEGIIVDGVTLTPDSNKKITIPLADASSQDGLITHEDKLKLDGVSEGAEPNVQADWNASSGDAQILNKPTIPTVPEISTNIETDGESDTKTASPKAVKTFVNNKLAAVYKPAGSLTAAQLVEGLLVVGNLGNVYNVSEDFTTAGGLFNEANGNTHEAGTNVVVIDVGSSVYKFDVLYGFIDLSGYALDSDIPTTPSEVGAEPADAAIQSHIGSAHAPSDAEKNVQSDWNATEGDALILNKPTIPSTPGEVGAEPADADIQSHIGSAHAPSDAEKNVQSDWNATEGDALILNKPTIPSTPGEVGAEPADSAIQLHIGSAHAPVGAEANVQADWNATEGDAQILNKPTIPSTPGEVGAEPADADIQSHIGSAHAPSTAEENVVEGIVLSDEGTPLTPDVSKNVTIPLAVPTGTGQQDGLMSHEDKDKLDGLTGGGEENIIEGVVLSDAGTPLTPDGSKNVTIPLAIPTGGTQQDGLMSHEDKAKLDAIAAGAEVNVQSDWNASSGDALILNKPTIPSTPGEVGAEPADTDIQSHIGSAHAPSDAEKNVIVVVQKNNVDLTPDANRKVNISVPTQASDIGAEPADADIQSHIGSAHAPSDAEKNVQSDWNATEGDALILNKPTIPSVPVISIDIEADGASDAKTTSPKSVKTYVDNKISSVYKPGGSLTASQIVAGLLVVANLGKVYNISETFTTTADFVEGTGTSHPAGTNIVIVDIGSSVYKFDVLSGLVDLSGYAENGDILIDGIIIDGTPLTPDGNKDVTIPSANATTQDGLMTHEDKSKLDGIAAGAEVNVQSDWNAGSGDAQILNKPTIPSTPSEVGLGNVTNDKQVKSAGHTMEGALVAQINTNYTTAQMRNVILSTSDPSGGNNGDIWIKYTA